jgi:glutaredoxin 3
MNLSYFRRSSFSMDETIERLKRIGQLDGFTFLGEAALPDSGARVLYLCKQRWADSLISDSPSLFGLLPCAVVVYSRAGKLMVGSGSPSVLGGVSDSAAVRELASSAELGIRKLIDEVTGAGALKPAAVKLYSTRTCPYCRLEKAWLDSKKIRFDLIYVDEDQAEADRLVERTGQMGVPVTEILYDDLESEFILGFDQSKLGKLLIEA